MRLIIPIILLASLIVLGCTQATITPTPNPLGVGVTARPTTFIQPADFVIENPLQAQQVDGGSSIQLLISSDKHKPADTYFHVFVDNDNYLPMTGFNNSITGLGSGKHKIRVQRVNKDQTEVLLGNGQVDPLTIREVTFTVVITATPSPKKRFDILSPKQGEQLTGPNVTVKLNTSEKIGTTNAPNKGEGHFVISIDETTFERVNGFEYELIDLEVGKHVLRVAWVNNDDTPITLPNGDLDATTAQQVTFVTNSTTSSTVPTPQQNPISNAMPTQAPNPSTTIQPTPLVSTLEVNMTASRFSFSPSTINAKLGDKVRLVINSTDTTHGISIPDLNVDENLPVGVTTVEFTANKAGTFSFRCSVSCGSGHGEMVGQIIVT